MNYYQAAARGKDLCQDRARMKLALAATPCCITPHHIKSQILHCNVSHRFCRSRPSRAKLQTWDKVNRAALVTQASGCVTCLKEASINLTRVQATNKPCKIWRFNSYELRSSCATGFKQPFYKWHAFDICLFQWGWVDVNDDDDVVVLMMMMMMVWRGYGVECH